MPDPLLFSLPQALILRFHILLSLLLIFSYSSPAQDSTWQADTELQYWADLAAYTTPSTETGTTYMGWLLSNSTISYQQKHSFNLSLMLAHGGIPSVSQVGDLQTFSNIEAGFLYGFYETFYQYEGKDFKVKLGQQDLNTDFLVSENALLFAHSSPGIDPVTTLNMPAPTYPFTSLALTVIWETSELLTLRTAIFDGQFTPDRKNFIPIDWSLRSDEGLLYILEPEFHLFQKKLSLKPGVYFHSGNFTNFTDSSTSKGLWAAYLVTDLVLYSKGKTSLNTFTQYSISSPELSQLQYYSGGGLRWINPLKWSKPHDLGIAIAHARIFDQWPLVRQKFNIQYETALELTAQVTPYAWLKVQPYFQWILRDDMGTEKPEPFIAALRAITTF